MIAGRILLLAAWVSAPQATASFDSVAIAEENRHALVVTEGYRAGSQTPVQGSASSVHSSGIVLTTYHQVSGLERLTLRVLNGDTYAARVLDFDEGLDLALVKAQAPLRATVSVGDARSLRMGSPLMAITSPLGLDFSAVNGIVSSMDRKYRGHDMIQTDLPASPGSSGGPVFDGQGLLIGIVMGKVEDVEGATLVNPINNAYALLRRHGIRVPGGSVQDPGANEIIPARNITFDDRAAIGSYNRGVRSRNLDKKILCYGKAVELLPQFFEAWFNLGVAWGDAEQPEKAARAYTEALRIEPVSIAAHRNLGRAYLRAKQPGKAAEAFSGMVRLMPGEASYRNDLGEAYRQLNRLDDAEASFKMALELSPSYGPAYFNLGLIYAASDRNGLAVSHFDSYLRQNPSASDAPKVRGWIEKLRHENP